MKRWFAVTVGLISLAASSQVYAQSAVPDSGAVIVTIIPGGATFFTEGSNTHAPSFSNYGLGGGVEVHINRYLGIEGEVTGAIGVSQDLQFANTSANQKTPNLLNYSGNLVVSAPTRSGVVPYVTGGVGGLTLFDQSELAISDTTNFLTGNVGGGVKWFSHTGRWGVRGDYRFTAVPANDQAPLFFGNETRYSHRVYGGLLINASR
jgi:opacity protein-like surface antigen